MVLLKKSLTNKTIFISMELNIIKNTEPAPKLGSRFGQDVEPKGTYVIEKGKFTPDGWVEGKAVINKPLIIPINDETLVSWKYEVSDQFKAKGKKLTDKLMAMGFDAIITRYPEGHTGEIILFPNSNFMLAENDTKSLIKKMLNEALNEEEDYRGSHRAPNRDNDPMYDLENTFGDDVYTPNCARYFGHGGGADDAFSCSVIRMAKGKPDQKIKIYRAVPKGFESINAGDWVTISPKYAKSHGSSYLDGFKVISMVVTAKDLFSDGNSIHEWGFDPQ
jgi:hypothetical protein